MQTFYYIVESRNFSYSSTFATFLYKYVNLFGTFVIFLAVYSVNN